MNKSIYIEGNDLYLSKRYLKKYASVKTMEFWNEGMGVIKINIDGELFFLYKSLPYRTKKKIPTPEKIISQERKKESLSNVSLLLHEAFYSKYAAYKFIYEKESSFTTAQVTKFSRLHAVFQAIIDLKKNESFRHLIILHEAFNELFPDKYKTKIAFSRAILQATVDGVMSIAMDKRTFGNNDRSKKKATPQIDYVIAALVASNGKFTNATMLEKANGYFKANGLDQYSISWMKKQRREWLKNPEVYKARYGQNEAQKKQPYPSLRNANYTHVQWQVDGVTLPFWENKFHRSVLVFVIDNCSKKIIGYAIGNTENSEIIKTAIRRAIYNTGVLPFEMVMDRHSFTQTQSAFNLEANLASVGAILTKTSNPRQKVIVERYNQNLDGLFKAYHGYLGKGVRSKSIEALTSDEKRTEYAQNFKAKDYIISVTTQVIEEYNNKGQRLQNGKSPNEVFIDNPHPHPIILNEFQKAKYLPFQLLKKIDRGQITIMRGVEKFEYQLPTELHQQWNDETVVITHDSLSEGIYLFKPNGEGIIFLHQKYRINNAKPVQTEEDIQALYRHKGRLKGIEKKARKQLEDIRDKALNVDPEAYLKLNPLTTSKDVIKELEQDSHIKMLAEKNGIIFNEMDTTETHFDLPISLKPKKRDSNPITVINNKIEIIDPTKNIDND